MLSLTGKTHELVQNHMKNTGFRKKKSSILKGPLAGHHTTL
jgi:hypothetical protein